MNAHTDRQPAQGITWLPNGLEKISWANRQDEVIFRAAAQLTERTICDSDGPSACGHRLLGRGRV